MRILLTRKYVFGFLATLRKCVMTEIDNNLFVKYNFVGKLRFLKTYIYDSDTCFNCRCNIQSCTVHVILYIHTVTSYRAISAVVCVKGT